MRHRFHSICPYFAMFPEAFAEEWIGRLTSEGDTVLDPFSGRGTTAFQAVMMGRAAVCSDTNAVAYCVSRAKTNAPRRSSIAARLTRLEREFDPAATEESVAALPPFFKACYHPKTLAQLVYLRGRLRWQASDGDAMLAALTLGVLHGEGMKTRWCLSNQMPRTISTKPAYSVRFWAEHGMTAPERDAFEVLRHAIAFRYVSAAPAQRAEVHHSDMRQLPWAATRHRGKVKAVVTSPPYLDTTNFQEDQWLRLWFLGGPPRPSGVRAEGDDRHERAGDYWNFIADTWAMLGEMLAPRGHVVFRIGARSVESDQLRSQLLASAHFSRRDVQLRESRVTEIRRRQTDAFRPGTTGCRVELDCHFQFG